MADLCRDLHRSGTHVKHGFVDDFFRLGVGENILQIHGDESSLFRGETAAAK